MIPRFQPVALSAAAAQIFCVDDLDDGASPV
jgi:hypothetical protein